MRVLTVQLWPCRAIPWSDARSAARPTSSLLTSPNSVTNAAPAPARFASRAPSHVLNRALASHPAIRSRRCHQLRSSGGFHLQSVLARAKGKVKGNARPSVSQGRALWTCQRGSAVVVAHPFLCELTDRKQYMW